MAEEALTPPEPYGPSETVVFYSDGVRLVGDIFRPTEPPPPSGYPTVIVCHGFGGIKEFFVGDIARALTAHGFLAMSFDYRGFGVSDGERHRLMPEEQAADVVAVVSYLRSRDDVDQSRIGAYGTSFGGGVAIAAAALEDRIRAVVCAVGIADCGRWLQSLRRYWEWLEFQERLDQDRIQRSVTGRSEVVEPEEIMVRDPHSAAHEAKLREKYPDRAFRLTLASGEAISRFKPVECVPALGSRALMLIGVEGDTLTPFDQTEELYHAATGPKHLLTVSGITHHEVYQPQHLFGVIESVAGFLREHMDIT